MPPTFDPWALDPGEAPLKPGEGLVTDTALAALDQVCWHLTCCDFIFDAIEEETDVLLHWLAADVEQARFRAESVYRAASQLTRITSDPRMGAFPPRGSGDAGFACPEQFCHP